MNRCPHQTFFLLVVRWRTLFHLLTGYNMGGVRSLLLCATVWQLKEPSSLLSQMHHPEKKSTRDDKQPGITSGWLTCPCQLGRSAWFQAISYYLLTSQTKQPIALLKLCLLPDNFSYFQRDTSKEKRMTQRVMNCQQIMACGLFFK